MKLTSGGVVLAIGILLLGNSPVAQSQSATGPRRPALSVQEIAKRNTPAVVTVTSPGGTGSGVIVDSSGVIVTNLHVLRGEKTAAVKLANGDVYDDVSVVDVDERKDILLIKIKAFGLPAASLGDSDLLTVGSRVTLIGSPRGLQSTVTDGVLSAARDSGDGYRLFQTSAAASPGSSGGGMFNDAGQLIGIVVSKITSGENLNFAIPINYVRGMLARESRMTLSELSVRFPPEASGTQSPAVGDRRPAPATAAASALGDLFQASGLKFTKVDDSTFRVDYRGDNRETVQVYAVERDGTVVISSTVAAKPTLTLEQLRSLFSLNYEADFGKLALDAEADLVALNEAESRTMDAAALKVFMSGVATIADDAAAILADAVPMESGRGLSAPTGSQLVRLDLMSGQSWVVYKSAEWKPMATDDPIKKQFGNANGATWVMTIAERTEIPLDRLAEIALSNAREASPAIKLTRRGRRTVNGLPMVFQEWEATVDKIPVTFYGHYYSDGSGSYQIIGWSGRNLAAEMRPVIESFVAGFQVRK